VLPGVEKRVLYLDQSLFSLLFKIESGGRLAPGHEESTREIYRRLRRVVLLQQAVLPHSDVHLDETIVFHSSDDLLAAYERIGGDVRLMNTREVECMQVAEYATAFIEQRDPALSFDVNKVLEDERNVWLPDMHIHAGANFAMLAECVRERRSRSHEAMQRLIERWAAERPTFDHLLDIELRTFFDRPLMLRTAIQGVESAVGSQDPMALFEARQHWILKEYEMLTATFRRAGVPERDVAREVIRFWGWSRNIEQPNHRIGAYMFAAIGKRVVNGQKSVSCGMINDIRAISTYAPYVDAMFVDRECAALLADPRLAADLQFKARIFSFTDPNAFIGYLDELEAGATDIVRAQATRIYGIE
jgi:hypothetical protein